MQKVQPEIGSNGFYSQTRRFLTPKLYCEVKSREVSSLIRVDFAQS